jgi:hypothetical protein
MSEGGEVGGLGRSKEREEAAEGDARDLEGMEESHKELARDMFEKITEYLNGELAGSCGYILILVGCECIVVLLHVAIYRPLYTISRLLAV